MVSLVVSLCVGGVGAGGLGRCRCGAPYVPATDDQVVERLALRASDQAARQLATLRAQWRRDPTDVAAAMRLAAAYIDQAGAEGDPRYVGYAQSALQHWWREPDPPAPVRVMRALVLQYDHRFDDALADLDAAVRADPDDAQAWAWITAIHLVRADLDRARQACERLAELTPDLVGAACHAQIDALTGHATQAATVAALRAAADPDADPALRLWALTRLAETEERRGDVAAAERAYRDALALDCPTCYLLAAYADFLLDHGRAAEVMPLLKDHARADVLLLRLAMAAKATQDPSAMRWRANSRRASMPPTRAATPAIARRSRALRWRCKGRPIARWHWRGQLRAAARSGRCTHPAGSGARGAPARGRAAGVAVDAGHWHRKPGAALAGGPAAELP